jgi:cytochrome c553/cytochrome c5
MRMLKIAALVALAAVAGAMQRFLPRPEALVDSLVPEDRGSGGARRKRPWLRLAALFAVFLGILGAGGFLVSASGIIPIKASAGHWPITEWLLKFSMHRSISTHTLGKEIPPLDDPALVLRGAGAYETGCRPCHGSPDLPQPRVARNLLPKPPYLPPVISDWDPEELFYITKHGVKFTGMPAWPAQHRDDEVWALVAFLLAFPELDTREYRQLVSGGPPQGGGDAAIHGLLGADEVPRVVTQTCGRCHGADGRGRGVAAFPRLAGQRPNYLYNALEAFASGKRPSGIMGPIAETLSREERRELALYYGNLTETGNLTGPAASLVPEADRAAIERGRRIASEGIPGQKVPSCADCHGPGGNRRNPNYPVLAGQYAGYLVQQLQLFQQQHRGGSAYAHLMRPVAARLTPDQMRDVAMYYASLAPGL